MRILVVNNFYPPRVGGSAHLSDALARGYAREGHEVLVLTAAFGGAPAVEQCGPNMRIVRLPAVAVPQTRLSVSFDIAFTMRPSRRRRLTALLDDFRPDVIHQHGQFFDLTWATGRYARRRKIPALLSVHTRLENPRARYHGVFRWLDALVVAPVLRRYQPRIVVMDVQMDEYIRHRYRGCYPELEYIPVGVDLSRISRGDAAGVRERHGFGDAPLIVSLGHVIPLRDRVALVEALPKVLAGFPDARLVVVGRVYYDLFLRRARELGVESAVTAAGPAAKQEVPDYLAAATVETHDLQGYGMGTATLESMAAGVPVVAGVRPDNFPGIELQSGTHCLLVPAGDADAIAEALIHLLGDADARARIGHGGRQLVREHFGLEAVLERHLRVLNGMTATGRAPGPGGSSRHDADKPVFSKQESVPSSQPRQEPHSMPSDGSASPEAATSRGRKLLTWGLRLARPAVAILILAAIGYTVASKWTGTPGHPGITDALRTLAWPSVVLSLAAIFAGTLTSLLAWRALLADEGYPLPVISAARIFLVGQLGKYLPGSVWAVVVQMELARREGVPRGRAFTTSLVFIALSLSTALAAGLLGLPVLGSAHHPGLWWLLAALPVLAVASLPPVLTRLVNIVLRLWRKGPLPQPLSWSGVLSAAGWLAGTWFFFGLHLWFLANALGTPGLGGLVRCIGGFALAMAAGVLFVIAPSGTGVREIVVVAALAPVMSTAEALGIAVVSRALFVIGDVASAGAAAVSGWRHLRRHPQPGTDQPPAAPAGQRRGRMGISA